MYYLRKAEDRGHYNHEWLDTYHSFSFADYYDPQFMGFRDLRVINEDTVAGGSGFPLHGHQDMEIVTYILDGELEHADTIGNKETLKPFEVQRMSAGQGIRHAEYNHSADKPVHLLQIWILTEKNGIAPSYEQKSFKDSIEKNKLTLVASRNARDGSLKIHQDVEVYVGNLKANENEKFVIKKDRHAWIQLARGELKVGDVTLKPGDGLAVSDEKEISMSSPSKAEFLLFDLN